MRLEPTLKVSRLAKYIIFIYVVISLVYATHHYFSIHHSSVDYKGSLNNNFIHNDESWSRKQQILQRLENIEKQKKLDKTTTWSMKGKLTLFFYLKTKITHPPPSPFTLLLGGKSLHTISHHFMSSKIFASSMGLDHVIPYYFKATKAHNTQDITLATLVTRDRFHVLSRLATNYQGNT